MTNIFAFFIHFFSLAQLYRPVRWKVFCFTRIYLEQNSWIFLGSTGSTSIQAITFFPVFSHIVLVLKERFYLTLCKVSLIFIWPFVHTISFYMSECFWLSRIPCLILCILNSQLFFLVIFWCSSSSLFAVLICLAENIASSKKGFFKLD